jgi:hypothetical protein
MRRVDRAGARARESTRIFMDGRVTMLWGVSY